MEKSIQHIYFNIESPLWEFGHLLKMSTAAVMGYGGSSVLPVFDKPVSFKGKY